MSAKLADKPEVAQDWEPSEYQAQFLQPGRHQAVMVLLLHGTKLPKEFTTADLRKQLEPRKEQLWKYMHELGSMVAAVADSQLLGVLQNVGRRNGRRVYRKNPARLKQVAKYVSQQYRKGGHGA